MHAIVSLCVDIEERHRQEAALKEKIHQLEDGGLMRIPADVQDFMDYIRTCHGITCVYGVSIFRKQMMQSGVHCLHGCRFCRTQ